MTREERSPSENGLVRYMFQNLFLQADEGVAALPVGDGDVDPEDTHQRVRPILLPRGLPCGSPRHPTRNGDFVQWTLEREDGAVYASDLGNDGSQGMFRSDDIPGIGQEEDNTRSEKFLQSPTTGEPLATAELVPVL